MKVTRDRPDHLILADTPWFIGIMLIIFIIAFVGPGLALMSTGGANIWYGLIFAGMGVTGFCLFVRRVQVIFDRRQGRVLIRRQSVFGYQQATYALSHLSRAEIESTVSVKDGHRRTLYRPVLIFGTPHIEERHPIIEAYTNGAGAQRMANAINEWLPAQDLDSGPSHR